MTSFKIYHGHAIRRENRGFRAWFNHQTKWFPSEIAAKHWINTNINKEKKT